ncbi:unnamed protein product, partial [Nesidiocoris tenuis]
MPISSLKQDSSLDNVLEPSRCITHDSQRSDEIRKCNTVSHQQSGHSAATVAPSSKVMAATLQQIVRKSKIKAAHQHHTIDQR